MVVTTNQTILTPSRRLSLSHPAIHASAQSIAARFRLGHRYVPWVTVTNLAGQGYGDAACFVEFGSGPAKGGKFIYIWSSLLAGPQGQALMADAVSWIVDGTLRPPPPRFNSIRLLNRTSASLNFSAVPNLAYALEFTNNLASATGPWPLLQEFGSAPTERSISSTASVSSAQTRFFRLWVRP